MMLIEVGSYVFSTIVTRVYRWCVFWLRVFGGDGLAVAWGCFGIQLGCSKVAMDEEC